MGIFSKLVKIGINTVTTPIAIVKDVVTLGGSVNDHGSYTAEKAREKGVTKKDD